MMMLKFTMIIFETCKKLSRGCENNFFAIFMNPLSSLTLLLLRGSLRQRARMDGETVSFSNALFAYISTVNILMIICIAFDHPLRIQSRYHGSIQIVSFQIYCSINELLFITIGEIFMEPISATSQLHKCIHKKFPYFFPITLP